MSSVLAGQLLDAVGAGRGAQRVAAEVGVEANGGVDVEDVAAAVVAVPLVGADVEHVRSRYCVSRRRDRELVATIGREAAHLIALTDGANVDGEVIRACRRRGAADNQTDQNPRQAPRRTRHVSHGARRYGLTVVTPVRPAGRARRPKLPPRPSFPSPAGPCRARGGPACRPRRRIPSCAGGRPASSSADITRAARTARISPAV